MVQRAAAQVEHHVLLRQCLIDAHRQDALVRLGLTLWMIGARESGTARLEEAVAAYRAMLQEWTRDRVPEAWAETQNNLARVLWMIGTRESGTASLVEAVAAYRAALEERARDRVPLDWAMSEGGQGVALMLLAQRLNDATKAKEAVQQIEVAVVTLRDGGNTSAAADYQAQLSKACALADRLSRP